MKNWLLLLIMVTKSSCAMEIIGHRGASALAPENTLISLEMALDAGMDGVEFDLQLTSDNVVVLAHDETLERVAANTFGVPEDDYEWIITSPIPELRIGEVQSIDVGAWKGFTGVTPPTLQQALLVIPKGKIALLDIKSDPRILDFLALEEAECEIILVAFSLKLIRAIKAKMPSVPCYYIRLNEQLEDNLEDILEDGADLEGFSFEAGPFITEDLVTILHKRGQKLMVWVDRHPAELDTQETRSAYEKMGVDYFITNGAP